MRDRRALAVAASLMTLAACRGGDVTPVAIEIGASCASCRMTIADAHLAAEIVAPGEDPRIYDDIGCLLDDLRKRGAPERARTFVVDYRTGALVPANQAIYTRLETIETPMASHLIAHADDGSRSADSRVQAGRRQTAQEIFGAAGAPGGTHAP
jgi:copper chaperone NosL